KSRILALPGTGDTIRGMTANLVILDEAAMVPDELLAAVTPMTIVSKGSIIALSTPKGVRGWFHDEWVGNDPEWHRVRVSADMCPRITAEDLERERKRLGDADFRREYFLEFLDSGMAAFPSALIEAVFTNDIRPLWS